MSAPPPTPDNPLERAVRILIQAGRIEASDAVRAALLTPPPQRAVLIAGEVKRGKSSLVNSLFCVDDLAGVNTRIATATQVLYVPSDVANAVGDSALLLPDGSQRPIRREEVEDWVNADGARAYYSVDGMIPVGAIVHADSPYLPNTTIIDSPGVNGLDPRHVNAVVTATAGACALVMVGDAMAPLSSTELDFLETISESFGIVMVAITKTDKNPTHWKEILAENRQLLARRSPRLGSLELIGVSNTVATASRHRADPARSAALLEASGIPTLTAILEDALGDPKRIALRAACACAAVGLEGLRAKLTAERRLLTDAPRVISEMDRERRRLEELSHTRSEWTERQRQQLNRVRLDAEQHLRKETGDLRERWKARIETVGPIEAARRGNELTAKITEELTALLDTAAGGLRDDLSGLATTWMSTADINDSAMEDALGLLDRLDLGPHREYKRWKGYLDPRTLAFALTGGPVGALLSGPLILLAPLGFAAWATVMLRPQMRKAGQSNLMTWLDEAVRHAREEATSVMKEVFNDFEPELRLAFRKQLDASIGEAKRRVAAAQEQSRRDETSRTGELNRLDIELQNIQRTLVALAEIPRAGELS